MPVVLKRMRQLAVLEFLNIGILGGAVLLVLPSRLEVGNLVGFALTALLLLQGAAYWALKAHQLRTRQPAPRGLSVFRVLRWANLLALAAGGVVAGYATATAPGWGSYPGAAFWLLAVLEQINYYYVQLSHETRNDLRRLVHTRRLHPSHLAIDLRRHR